MPPVYHSSILLYTALEGAQLNIVHLERAYLIDTHLAGAYLVNAHLAGAHLSYAHLEGAHLSFAYLEGAYLDRAHLEGAKLYVVHLEGAHLDRAHLEGADLRSSFFDSATKLDDVFLSNDQYGSISLTDIHWDDVNVAVVDWSSLSVLGDEYKAREQNNYDGKLKDKPRQFNDYRVAVRAYRQLSVVLRNQGLNEDAARFAYRAQMLQRTVFRLQEGARSKVQYLFSLFLDLLAGYGYKPWRSFLAYLLVIGIFAALYFYLGAHLAWNEAIVISMTAFHGRGFFPNQFHPGDPQALVAAIEALVGLLIEVTFIATLTQRLFGK